MAAMTIRLPDEKQKRLAQLAKHLGVSLNKLIDEFATIRLAQFDAEIRFRHLAQKGSIQQGLKSSTNSTAHSLRPKPTNAKTAAPASEDAEGGILAIGASVVCA